MNINIVGDGSAGRRHAALLGARGHHCTILGPDKASPVQHPECDAVVIASPPDSHKLYLSWYWDKCHILCEGPVTWVGSHNEGEWKETELNPGELGMKFFPSPFVRMTASNWRFTPQIQNLKRIIKNPVIGHFFFDYDLAKWRPDVDYRTTCYYTSGIDMINLHSVDLKKEIGENTFIAPMVRGDVRKQVHVVKKAHGVPSSLSRSFCRRRTGSSRTGSDC